MDATSTCDRRENLVAYLYGECEAEERERIEGHLVSCGSCAAEVDALRSVRRSLAAWAPPDAELGFRIVSDPPRREGSWRRRVSPRPVWGVAAAGACVVAAFAVGALDLRWKGTESSSGWAGRRRVVPSPRSRRLPLPRRQGRRRPPTTP